MAVGSLVLGIIGLICSLFVAGLNWVGALMGIVGAVLGAMGRKDPEKKGMATAGLVLSILAIVFGLIMFIACAACIGAVATASAW